MQFRLTTVEESLKTAETYLKADFTERMVMLGGPDPAENPEVVARELLPWLRARG